MHDAGPDAPRCERLEWDSEFFGRRIARVSAPQLDEADMARILDWCAAEAVECLYLRFDPGHHPTVALAEDNGFRLMDIRITLARPLEPGLVWPEAQSSELIRPCTPSDVPALKAIAAASHHDTRFYCDPSFPDEQCDALYERWIENSATGDGNAIHVAELDGEPVGYATCSILDGTHSAIGLHAVDVRARGRGIGSALIDATLHWLTGRGIAHITTCTQAHNLRTQRLYQRRGFRTLDVSVTYHRWFGADSDE